MHRLTCPIQHRAHLEHLLTIWQLHDGRVVHLRAEGTEARREWMENLLSLAAARATRTLQLASGSEWEMVQVGA